MGLCTHQSIAVEKMGGEQQKGKKNGKERRMKKKKSILALPLSALVSCDCAVEVLVLIQANSNLL